MKNQIKFTGENSHHGDVQLFGIKESHYDNNLS